MPQMALSTHRASGTSQKAVATGKHAFMAQARVELESRPGWRGDAEDVVSLACRRMFEDAGVHEGCTVEVLTGRHAGLRFPVAAINWSEAEIRGVSGRWFGLWHKPEFRVVEAA